MSYTPTNWQTGDTITATLLNKMEQGIASAGGGGVLVVNADQNGVLDRTWQEIADNKFAVIVNAERGIVNYLVQIASNPYDVVFLDLSTSTPSMFSAESADDYPVYVSIGGGNGGGN